MQSSSIDYLKRNNAVEEGCFVVVYLLLYDCNVLHQLCFITITGHLLTLYDCITEHLNSERTNYRSPSNYTQEHYMDVDIHW